MGIPPKKDVLYISVLGLKARLVAIASFELQMCFEFV